MACESDIWQSLSGRNGRTDPPCITALQGGHEQGLLVTVGERPDDIDLCCSRISTVREHIRFCDHRGFYRDG
jgi:hypothetical protein